MPKWNAQMKHSPGMVARPPEMKRKVHPRKTKSSSREDLWKRLCRLLTCRQTSLAFVKQPLEARWRIWSATCLLEWMLTLSTTVTALLCMLQHIAAKRNLFEYFWTGVRMWTWEASLGIQLWMRCAGVNPGPCPYIHGHLGVPGRPALPAYRITASQLYLIYYILCIKCCILMRYIVSHIHMYYMCIIWYTVYLMHLHIYWIYIYIYNIYIYIYIRILCCIYHILYIYIYLIYIYVCT